MKDDKQILLVAQKNASQDDPGRDDIYRVGTVSSVLQLLKLPDGTVKVLVEGNARARIKSFVDNPRFFQVQAEVLTEGEGEARETEALVRAVVAQFEQYVKLNKKVPPEVLVSLSQIDDPAKLADTVAAHLSLEDRRQAGAARDRQPRRAAGAALRLHGGRDLGPAGREAHPQPRQAADGEDAARVLPQRADEGDPEGAGRARGRQGRGLRARGADQEDQAHQGGPRQGPGRAEEAAHDEPDVGRGHGRAQLPRLDALAALEEADQGQQGHQARPGDPRHRPLRPGEGQGADRRVPRGPAARRQDEGPDPVPGRPARRRQDLARQVAGQGHGPQLHPLLAGRHPRRGRDPRPPADLYRLDAGQDHPADEEGEERPTRSSCWTRSTRWAPTSAATRPRPCSRSSTPSRTSTSTTTISRSTTTSRT